MKYELLSGIVADATWLSRYLLVPGSLLFWQADQLRAELQRLKTEGSRALRRGAPARKNSDVDC